MRMISDLSQDLVEEILSRVPITSLRAVRSTCKPWNVLYKDPRFTKKHCSQAANEFLVITTCDDFSSDGSTWRFNLNRIHNIKDLSSSIKEIGKILSPLEILQVYQCDGLFLCICLTKEDTWLMVWNPYLAQTKWIKPINSFRISDWYAIGYDNNNNHKILSRYHGFDYSVKHQIYDFKSNSWRVLNIAPKFLMQNWNIAGSLKGNSYSVAHKSFFADEEEEEELTYFLLCFDFTTERFGPRLPISFLSGKIIDVVTSYVREEQLAVCLVTYIEMEIWITTKIEPDTVSWSNFFKVNMTSLAGCDFLFKFKIRSFFIDKKKKVVVVSGRRNEKSFSYVVGEGGYYEEMDLTEVFSYVPSSVQIM